MSRITAILLSAGLLGSIGFARAGESTPAETVTKDAKGRVTFRATTADDGSGHRMLAEFVAESDKPSTTVDEDFDGTGRVTRRVEQRFDEQGRIREKTDVRFDEEGKKTGTRTRYQYDASGSRSESSTPIS